MQSKTLCFKCLNGGHFIDRCPKETCVKYEVALRNIKLCYTPTLGVQLERVSTLHSSRESDQQTSAGTGHTSEANGINQEDQSISAV